MPITVAQILFDLALIVLLVSTYTDLRWRIVPNTITLPALLTALAGLFFTPDWLSRLGAAGFVLLIYILRVLLTRRGCDRPVGMGDVKLLLFLALAVGFPALFGSVALMCVGSLGFYAVQIARGRLSRTDPIPLVPFIALGVGGVAIWQLLI